MPRAEDFRAAMARVASGVVVVTAVVDGLDHAMTANSFTSVSLSPPLVLFCVQEDVRFHEAIQEADHWVVNLLGGHQADTARWFAKRGRPLAGQMERVDHRRTGRGIPVLEGIISHLECRTEAIHPAGDHSIVVGRVEALGEVDGDLPPLLFLDHGLGPACIVWSGESGRPGVR